MKDINFNLTTDEANIVMEALGNLPFVKVYNIIGKIQAQASEQLNSSENQILTQEKEISKAKKNIAELVS
jgi:hypothetical protein